jgi:iron(III)-enterobactin esterase
MMSLSTQEIELKADFVDKPYLLKVFLPPDFTRNQSYPLLLLNDGQDFETMQMSTILKDIYRHQLCKPFILVGIEAIDRLQTYGVSGILDYKGRGAKAEVYSSFLVKQVIPSVKSSLGSTQFSEISIGGFSLGGLSAFDIAWGQPETFSKVMVCSGSFWWRTKDLKDGYTDADRIMHQKVRNTANKPSLKIWLQCGTLDEKEDRNQNGIIDSVDDMLDLVQELKLKGFQPQHDLFYNEVIGGKHNLETYGIVLPYFIHWAFGK